MSTQTDQLTNLWSGLSSSVHKAVAQGKATVSQVQIRRTNNNQQVSTNSRYWSQVDLSYIYTTTIPSIYYGIVNNEYDLPLLEIGVALCIWFLLLIQWWRWLRESLPQFPRSRYRFPFGDEDESGSASFKNYFTKKLYSVGAVKCRLDLPPWSSWGESGQSGQSGQQGAQGGNSNKEYQFSQTVNVQIFYPCVFTAKSEQRLQQWNMQWDEKNTEKYMSDQAVKAWHSFYPPMVCDLMLKDKPHVCCYKAKPLRQSGVVGEGDEGVAPSGNIESKARRTISIQSQISTQSLGTIYQTQALLPKPEQTKSGFPIVFFQHGLYGSMELYSTTCADMARHGYIVIAPEFDDGTAIYAKKRELCSKEQVNAIKAWERELWLGMPTATAAAAASEKSGAASEKIDNKGSKANAEKKDNADKSSDQQPRYFREVPVPYDTRDAQKLNLGKLSKLFSSQDVQKSSASTSEKSAPPTRSAAFEKKISKLKYRSPEKKKWRMNVTNFRKKQLETRTKAMQEVIDAVKYIQSPEYYEKQIVEKQWEFDFKQYLESESVSWSGVTAEERYEKRQQKKQRWKWLKQKMTHFQQDFELMKFVWKVLGLEMSSQGGDIDKGGERSSIQQQLQQSAANGNAMEGDQDVDGSQELAQQQNNSSSNVIKKKQSKPNKNKFKFSAQNITTEGFILAGHSFGSNSTLTTLQKLNQQEYKINKVILYDMWTYGLADEWIDTGIVQKTVGDKNIKPKIPPTLLVFSTMYAVDEKDNEFLHSKRIMQTTKAIWDEQNPVEPESEHTLIEDGSSSSSESQLLLVDGDGAKQNDSPTTLNLTPRKINSDDDKDKTNDDIDKNSDTTSKSPKKEKPKVPKRPEHDLFPIYAYHAVGTSHQFFSDPAYWLPQSIARFAGTTGSQPIQQSRDCLEQITREFLLCKDFSDDSEEAQRKQNEANSQILKKDPNGLDLGDYVYINDRGKVIDKVPEPNPGQEWYVVDFRTKQQIKGKENDVKVFPNPFFEALRGYEKEGVLERVKFEVAEEEKDIKGKGGKGKKQQKPKGGKSLSSPTGSSSPSSSDKKKKKKKVVVVEDN